MKDMEVTSKNLKNGVWDTVITKTSFGENLSPELSFDKVDGAVAYAIYMIDPDGHNWLHWKYVTSENSIEEGEDKSTYVGPYPPSGTHTYIVYVFALEKTPSALPGSLDSSGADEKSIEKELNSKYKILAKGTITGTYTHGAR